MGKPKQFTRPPKKQKSKFVDPETADEYQEAADREEEAGGKHRVGDPAKSGRAFVRALEIYDRGLHAHPGNFDLAYNNARLQLEITQSPPLVAHIGVPLIDLLTKALESHRYALKLNEESPDVLFNTSQVLISLAEQLSDAGQSHHAIPLLQESLELLSSCLSRQEMLMEEQQADFQDVEQGGVQLDPDELPASGNGSDVSESEQTALVETPLTARDLLDTLHASLSSLTTLIPLVDPPALQTYGDMAQTLTEKKAQSYIALLPMDFQQAAQFSVGLDRAILIAAFADAQYGAMAIDLETYLQRLDAFDVKHKEESAHALSAEAEARTEFVLSVIDRVEGATDLPAQPLWKQLTLAQDLYNTVTKSATEDSKERKAQVYQSKGDVELLRHRLASMGDSSLSDGIRKSAKTLATNAQTFYKGSAQLARSDGDQELETKSKQRWLIAAEIGAILYGIEAREAPFEGNSDSARGDLLQALEGIVDEGYIDNSLAEAIMMRIRE